MNYHGRIAIASFAALFLPLGSLSSLHAQAHAPRPMYTGAVAPGSGQSSAQSSAQGSS